MMRSGNCDQDRGLADVQTPGAMHDEYLINTHISVNFFSDLFQNLCHRFVGCIFQIQNVASSEGLTIS